MSLPSIANFDVSFIERTKTNLDDYAGKYEFTMLLNSLLGLVIVPKESKDKRKFTFDFLSKKLSEFSEFRSIFEQKSHHVIKDNKEVDFPKLYWLSDTDNEIDFGDITVDAFLSRLRHGVAHFGFMPIACPDKKDDWCGIVIRNCRQDQKNNFEVCFMQDEIKALAEFIARKYTETVKT